jgi:hypothetical protein
MRKSQTRKKLEVTRAANNQRSEQALEIATKEPDSLRDSVREALLRLSEEEQRGVHNGLLSALRRAGVNIGHHLLLLGIPARTAEELTATEMGILIRYLRISEPRAMAAVAPILIDVLARHAESARPAKPSRRAA